MPNYRQYEKDERASLRRIVDDMSRLYSGMGGRTNRPERKALLRAMHILQKEIERYTLEHNHD